MILQSIQWKDLKIGEQCPKYFFFSKFQFALKGGYLFAIFKKNYVDLLGINKLKEIGLLSTLKIYSKLSIRTKTMKPTSLFMVSYYKS